MNLFASFAANNSLWLLWYRMVIGDPDVIQQNEVIHLLFYHVFFSLFLSLFFRYQVGRTLYFSVLFVVIVNEAISRNHRCFFIRLYVYVYE